MPLIKHIAILANDNEALAEFYMKTFGMKMVGGGDGGAIYVSDGYINLALISARGRPEGIFHFGFEVDDLDEACQKLENAHAQRLTAKDGVDATMAGGGHANFEMKWSGPDGVAVRDSELAATELCTVKATALPR